MPDKTLGIIGGAGPMAGAYLLQKIIENCQKIYSCKDDADFPKIIFISVPFSDMLSRGQIQEGVVQRQLNEAFTFLTESGADAIAIACNTLHAFITEKPPNLISLVEETESYISRNRFKNVLALCTHTASEKDLYRSLQILDPEDQALIDYIIETVLSGKYSERQSYQLERVILSCMEEDPTIDGVILGCSELSLLCSHYPIPAIPIIDPVDIIAKRLAAFGTGS